MNNKYIPFLIFLFLTPLFLLSQHYEVRYHSFNNDKRNENGDKNIIFKDGVVYLSEKDANIKNFSDLNKRENISIIDFESQLYKTIVDFDDLPQATNKNDYDTIMGNYCRLAKYKYFSNSIDVWYTFHPQLKGSPYMNFIPFDDVLVMKVVINGNRSLVAQQIREIEEDENLKYPYEESITISAAEMEELKIRSRYQSQSIFMDQQINFDPSIPKEKIDSKDGDIIYRLSMGAVVMKKIILPELCREGAYCFAELKVRSNGDAYDRTGSVFAVIPDKKQSMLDALFDSIQVVPSFIANDGKKYQGFRQENNFIPAMELMRFFTSFGAGHFNDKRVINNYPWKETAIYKQDITALIPNDKDSIWIGVFIGNYDKGGHKIDLDLHFYPSFEETNKASKWIQPLFNTVNIMEMSGQQYPRLFKNDTLEVEFEVPEGIEGATLVFTSTGHGGWGGGDEFNPKMNKIFLDDQLLFKVVPWRTDCATYRLYNPASGNFENGMSSSDFSRSNWCPGTVTPPYFIPVDNLKVGKHQIKIIIDQGEDEGNSFNAWSVSGILTAYRKKMD